VPSEAVDRILNGYYDLWDKNTVYWEERCPEKGKRIMELLGPAYDFPFGHTSIPSDMDLTHMAHKAFPQAAPGPLPRMHNASLMTSSQLGEFKGMIKWLDEYTAPSCKLLPLDDEFPWGPAEAELRKSGRFEFQVYSDILPDEKRLRLWESFTNTLRYLWTHIDGTNIPSIVDPWLIRDMWTQGNCLPIGFSLGSSHSFIFLVTHRSYR
jgi:hypothetical protein